MAKKDETQIVYDMRVDLGDVAETEWDTVDLVRAYERAVADLSRFLPRELTYDIDLGDATIEEDVRIDLDDYIDADGGMEDVIRINRVEYPTDQVPQHFVSFDYYDHKLTITGGVESDEQPYLNTSYSLRIYYDSPHVVADDDEPGTCPAFLDNTVLLAASAYAMFQKAMDYISDANANYTLAGTALTNAGTALAKVATYLEDNSSEDSKYWLTKITTDIAGLRTATLTALDAMNSYLDSVATDISDIGTAWTACVDYVTGATAPAVKKYLDDGDAYLNTIADGGEGQEVPHAYRQYAQTVADGIVSPYVNYMSILAQKGTQRTNAAMIYAQEAAQRLSNLRSYIEQADAWGMIAQRFIVEAEQRLADSVQYTNVADNQKNMAAELRQQAIERRNEAWSIWRDRTQYIGDFSQTPVRQMPQYS